MTPFCKVFETEESGQIVVMKSQNDDGQPSINFYVQPPVERMEVSFLAAVFTGTEAGKERDKHFDKVDEATARSMATKVLKLALDIDAQGGAEALQSIAQHGMPQTH